MIGEATIHATATFAGGKVSIRVTAVTPYGDRSVSVSEDLSAELIDGRLATIRAQRKRVPKEIAELQSALDKGKLEGEELRQAEQGLASLQKTLVRLDADEKHQELLNEVLTKASPKLEAVFAGVIKSLSEDLKQRAFGETARAVTVAFENEEKL